MFARLCVYIFFLVAITTIAIGAPLEASSPKLITRRALLEKYGSPNRTQSRLEKYGHLSKRDYFAHCIEDDDVYVSSYCLAEHTFVINCAEPDGDAYYYTDGCEEDEYCVDYIDRFGLFHATCLNVPHYRTWTTSKNELACSLESPFDIKGNLTTGVTTYDDEGNTIDLHELQTFKSGQVVNSNFSKHNISTNFFNYNSEEIKFCFTSGFDYDLEVTAYAAGFDYDTVQGIEQGKYVPPVPVASLG
ncbi:hypothetical protein RclHR1_01480002 [Rhizophagus clarus]|uniref:Uncharacterized protein n=1 Tax=Rhizophagus clarus TaxID=94130 RepID=A0A2Z6QDJ0_9GLOM|nr:hypothetical protein RclHR1_01480002 [Rhizophagus clarus]GET00893.1 hypothetical protein GLOIN_2v1484647 [Rhizophagus clarus]